MPSLEDVPDEHIKREKNESDLNKVKMDINEIRNSDKNSSKSINIVEEVIQTKSPSSETKDKRGKKKIHIEETKQNNECSELKEKLLMELSSDVKPHLDEDDEFEFKSCTDDFKSCDGGDGTENGELDFDQVECTNLDDLD